MEEKAFVSVKLHLGIVYCAVFLGIYKILSLLAALNLHVETNLKLHNGLCIDKYSMKTIQCSKIFDFVSPCGVHLCMLTVVTHLYLINILCIYMCLCLRVRIWVWIYIQWTLSSNIESSCSILDICLNLGLGFSYLNSLHI